MDGERQTEPKIWRWRRVPNRMCPENKKLHILGSYKTTDLYKEVSQALVQVETTNQDLASDLKDIYFNHANQIHDCTGCKAVVICYPHKFRERFHKIYLKLVTQLKPILRVDDVFLIARIHLSRPRFELDVRNAMLEDIIYPAKILGVFLETDDNLRTISYKVYLDHDEKFDSVDKLQAFVPVFKELTGKVVMFEYIEAA